MSDRFADEGMEDLAYDEAEGAADQYDEGADLGDMDAGEEGDEFLRGIVGGIGRIAGGLMGGGGGDGFDELAGDDEFDALDEGDGFEGDAEEASFEAFEDAVADALEAEDSDEFFRRLAGIARRVGRTVGQVARVAAPIARLIPHPAAQAVGRIAGVLGQNLADEFDVLEDVFDEAEAEDAIDAAAPLVAGLTIRSRMPGVARAPRPMRRQLVRSVAQATRVLARRHGPRAARAVPAVVGRVQQAVRRRAVPVRRTPQAVRAMVQRVVRNPRAVRSLVQQARVLAPAHVRRIHRRHPHWVGVSGPASSRRARTFNLRGPVQITIRGR